VRGGPDGFVDLSLFGELNEENKFSPRAYARCRFHFMLIRRDEVQRFGAMSLEEMKHALAADRAFLTSIDAEDLGGHLVTWASVL
jgi:hypothetical protein